MKYLPVGTAALITVHMIHNISSLPEKRHRMFISLSLFGGLIYALFFDMLFLILTRKFPLFCSRRVRYFTKIFGGKPRGLTSHGSLYFVVY